MFYTFLSICALATLVGTHAIAYNVGRIHTFNEVKRLLEARAAT